MKRKNKNILILLLIAILVLETFFTMKFANENHTNMILNKTPPDMPNNIQEPLEKPSVDNNTITSDNQEENYNNTQDDNTQSPLEKPEGNNHHNLQENNFNNYQSITKRISLLYIVFIVESLLISLLLIYLLMSKFNKKTFKETVFAGNKLIIYIISVAIITSGITYLDTVIYKSKFKKNINIPNKEMKTTSNDASS